MKNISSEYLRQELEAEEELVRLYEDDELTYTLPNPSQLEFCNSHERYVQMSGGNQLGKSWILRLLAMIWITGDYPDWYRGPILKIPEKDRFGVIALVAYSKNKLASLFHAPLFGPKDDRGAGWIPRHMLDVELINKRFDASLGLPDYVPVAKVRWPDGKHVEVRSYSYGHGEMSSIRRTQGEPFIAAFVDEELPEEYWDELKSRFIFTQGFVRVAATPQFGRSPFWLYFNDELNPLTKQIIYTVDDATHLSPAHRQAIIEEHQHSPLAMARLYGQPVVGHGLIFPDLDSVVVDDFGRPEQWKYLIGIDIPHTTGHFAAALLGIDPDGGRMHVFAEYQGLNEAWEVYASACKRLGADRIEVAYPHDAGYRVGGSAAACELLSQDGCKLMGTSAYMETPEGRKDKSPMTAVEMMTALMTSGRFTIAQSCTRLLDQMRVYAQKDGKIFENQADHIIDAVLKAVMMSRFAKRLPDSRRTEPRVLGEYDFYA